MRTRMACVLALVLASGPALAATVSMSPSQPPATMNFTVLPDGTIQGKQTLSVTITRKEKNSAVLQSCDKIHGIEIDAMGNYITRKAGWLYFYKHPLCNFTKTVTYYPFSGDVIRGRCLGNSSRTIQNQILVIFWDVAGGANHEAMSTFWGKGISAHITCENGTATSSAANIHPINACNLSGSWPVWQTAPGRQAAVPFVLTATQGRSDIYQVSTPNNAGVTGTAWVNDYKVTISLQGNGTQMQSFSGAFNRSCSTLSGQAVASEPPFRLTATRRGGASGNSTARSVHTSRSSPAPEKTRQNSSLWKPQVNTRVSPKWNTQLR